MNRHSATSTVAGLAAAALLCGACKKEMIDTTPNIRALTAQEAALVKSSNDFAYRIFASISESERAANVFISPLSISTALGMAYNGADGDTREAMRKALGIGLPSDEEVNRSYRSLMDLLRTIDPAVQFQSSNALWINNRDKLQAPFLEASQTYFDATVQPLDFDAPASVDVINDWVKTSTNDKIDRIMNEISPRHTMYLMNAIYFKGSWTRQFDKSLTRPDSFHLEDGSSVAHDFMQLENGRYLLYEDDTKQLIDLPYGDRQFSMTLLVPRGEQNVSKLLSELSAQALETWLSAADSSGMTLHLPRFTIEYERDLKETLTQLGMGIAFSDRADFSRMVEGRTELAISKATHKTFVEVNEEGTEAAAVTSFELIVTSEPPSIHINRPFVFLIRERSSGAVMFIGKLMQPG